MAFFLPRLRVQVNKYKMYSNTRFDSKTLSAAEKAIRSATSRKIRYFDLSVSYEDAQWKYDTLEEFLAAADQGPSRLQLSSDDGYGVTVSPDVLGRSLLRSTHPRERKSNLSSPCLTRMRRDAESQLKRKRKRAKFLLVTVETHNGETSRTICTRNMTMPSKLMKSAHGLATRSGIYWRKCSTPARLHFSL